MRSKPGTFWIAFVVRISFETPITLFDFVLLFSLVFKSQVWRRQPVVGCLRQTRLSLYAITTHTVATLYPTHYHHHTQSTYKIIMHQPTVTIHHHHRSSHAITTHYRHAISHALSSTYTINLQNHHAPTYSYHTPSSYIILHHNCTLSP